MTSKKPGPADPLRFKQWLAQLTWTPAHAAAYRELERRSVDVEQRSFEETYPQIEHVNAWLEAAFVDIALACRGQHQRKLTPAFAQTIAFQTRRSWGWNGTRWDEEAPSERETVRAHSTILSAVTGAWNDVASALGSRPLARKVTASKTYDAPALAGLVRHVATAAKNHLGEGSCQAALKAWAENPRSEPGPLLALACLAIEGAGGHPRAEVATRLEALLTSNQPAPVKTARRLVEDPKASVFERYLPVLSDETMKKRYPELNASHAVTEWLVHAWVLGLDEVVARELEKPERRNLRLPNAALVAAACLGRGQAAWRATLREDLKQFHSPRKVSSLARYRWSTQVAAIALAVGDTKLVMKLTVGPKKERFKAGKGFGEDARRTLRYFAMAIDAGATQVDVTPAWLELLVARVPEHLGDTMTGGRWSWPSLLCLAYTYFHVLGGAPENQVGRLLRDTLRGVE